MFLCLCCSVLCDSTGGPLPPRRRGEFELTMPRNRFSLDAFTKAWFPPRGFVDFFSSVFLGLVAFFFFLLSWWGSPCRVFPPPCFLVLGGWVGDFCCLLRLASFFSFASRATWSSDPQPPRPSQPLVLARATSPISCWELSVGRAEAKGCGVTGGVVTPHIV